MKRLPTAAVRAVVRGLVILGILAKGCTPAPVYAQTTTITASNLKMAGAPIATGTVTFTPVNLQGNPIPFADATGAQNGPTAFSCKVTTGAIVGAIQPDGTVSGTCTVPDATQTVPANILYTEQTCDTSTGRSTSGKCYTLQGIVGISGSAWALDHYGPPAQTTNVATLQAAVAPTTPTSCIVPSVFTNSNTHVFYTCVGGTLIPLTGGSGGSVTLETNGAANPNQSTLNLKAGINVTLTPDSGGGVTVSAAGGGGGTTPTGTGFAHFTGGAQDAAARPVNLASADVAGSLPYTSVAGLGAAATHSASLNVSGTPCALDTNCVLASGGVVLNLYAFGTSIADCYGATSVGTCWFGRWASTTTASPANYGVAGSTISNAVRSVFANYVPLYAGPSAIYFESGENDGACTTSACVTHVTNMYTAVDAYAATPPQYFIWASTVAQTGTWASDGNFPNAFPYASPGNAVGSTVSGSTLTFTIPASTSTHMFLYFGVGTAMTGTFHVSLDGAALIDDCSGTSTFSAVPCSTINGDNYVEYAEPFAITAGVSHTVVISTTNSGESLIYGVSTVSPSSTSNNNIVFHGTVLSTYASYATLNPISQSVANALKGYGMSVHWVDMVGGTTCPTTPLANFPCPGVNATTDMSTTENAICPASTIGGHPDDCGQLHYFQTLMATQVQEGINLGSLNSVGEGITNTGRIVHPLCVGANVGSLCSISPTGAYHYLSGNGFFLSGPNLGYRFIQDGGNTPTAPWNNAFTIGNFSIIPMWDCMSQYAGGNPDLPASFTPRVCRDNNGNTAQAGVDSYQIGTARASAATIAPTNKITPITSCPVPIASITPPPNYTSTFGGGLYLLFSTTCTTVSGGNITGPGTVTAGLHTAVYDGANWWIQ